jgi:hypothetical protein
VSSSVGKEHESLETERERPESGSEQLESERDRTSPDDQGHDNEYI